MRILVKRRTRTARTAESSWIRNLGCENVDVSFLWRLGLSGWASAFLSAGWRMAVTNTSDKRPITSGGRRIINAGPKAANYLAWLFWWIPSGRSPIRRGASKDVEGHIIPSCNSPKPHTLESRYRLTRWLQKSTRQTSNLFITYT